MNKTSINKITMYNILSTILLQGVALFTSPIFSRMLGTTNYGIVAIYNTWISVISIVFGLQTQSTIAVARNEYGEDEQEKYQSSIFCSLYFIQYCNGYIDRANVKTYANAKTNVYIDVNAWFWTVFSYIYKY